MGVPFNNGYNSQPQFVPNFNPWDINEGSLNFADNLWMIDKTSDLVSSLPGQTNTTPLKKRNSAKNIDALLSGNLDPHESFVPELTSSQTTPQTYMFPPPKEGRTLAQKASIMLGVGNSLGTLTLMFANDVNGAPGGQTKAFNTISTVTDGIADVASNFGPMGQMIGGALKTANFALNAINSLGGKKADTFYEDTETTLKVGSSYGGSMSEINEALNNSGVKFGLFAGGDRHRANLQMKEARRQQSVMRQIANTATDRFNLQDSMTSINSNARNLAMSGGYLQSAVHVGRQGLKLEIAKRIVSKYRMGLKLQSRLTTKFEEGGKFNVIPEGALHARLHNMDIDGITKKGIPVVSESEGGEIVQLAEIEKNELILRLSVTKELEALMEDGTDEAAIKAGKLLVLEILENTLDNTNLINTI